MTPTEVVTLMIAVVTALGLRELLAKAVDLRASKQSRDATTNATEVETIRSVLAEVRANDAAKTQRLSELERRVLALEERERHALTRAAVHEAWDQLAFQALITQNPNYPSPPPLSIEDTREG